MAPGRKTESKGYDEMRYAATQNGFLRMCIDCKHSKMYQAVNTRNVWFYCEYHKVSIHYNESCENYIHQDEDKEQSPLEAFPDKPGKEGIL